MKLKAIVKRYGEKTALDIPELHIGAGEITAVLGESGAGKTTLLNVIAGALPHEGTVRGAGRVSYLFQSPKLLPHLTAEENLKFVLPKEKWGEIPAMLKKVGLEGREKARPSELSGGEKQRVAIARAFLFPHDTLLMDEPFSSLDLSLKKSLLALAVSLWQETGSTVVFVTHDVREAALLSQRALVLREGKIVADLENPAPFPRDFFAPSPVEEGLVRALMRENGD